MANEENIKPKEKKQNKSTAIIVILLLIIIAMAGAFTYVIINRDEIFNDSDSDSKSSKKSSKETSVSTTSNSSSSSKSTPQEIYEMLKEDGFYFSVILKDYGYYVSASGSNDNDGIYISLDFDNKNSSSTSLSFRDSSIDSDNDYTNTYLKGKSNSSNNEKQQKSAERWLKSYRMSADQLQQALEYAYQIRVYTTYQNIDKDAIKAEEPKETEKPTETPTPTPTPEPTPTPTPEPTKTPTPTKKPTTTKTAEPALSIKEYQQYTLKSNELLGYVVFENHSFTYAVGYPNSGGVSFNGTYAQNGNNITFYVTSEIDEDGIRPCNSVWSGKISNGGKTVTITFENGSTSECNL